MVAWAVVAGAAGEAQAQSAAQVGEWSPVQSWYSKSGAPFGAVHAALLANGKVMAWSRRDAGGTGTGPQVVIWTPPTFPSNTGTFSETAPSTTDDLFCVGQNAGADGRLLTFGGHVPGGKGLNAVNVYDPYADSWTKMPHDMNAARWYPTSTTLGNGETVVLGGTVNAGSLSNDVPQVYRPGIGFHTLGNSEAVHPNSYYYPWLFPRGDGRIFNAGPLQRTRTLEITRSATPWTGTWTTGIDTNAGLRDYGSAVMYRPDRILLVGGGGDASVPLPGAGSSVSQSAEVIDLGSSDPSNPPSWRYTAAGGTGTRTDPAYPRRQHNLTILPDGRVLVTGGCSGSGFLDEATPVRAAELWDPTTEAFSTMASFSTSVRRIYHSLALLLPDGRVLSAGGGYYVEGSSPSDPNNFPNAEIYAPPYLFASDGTPATRPTITSMPTTALSHGGTFSVNTPDASAITRVTLVRLGAVTHSFNADQRFAELSFETSTATSLAVTMPANANTTPPGHYMLFLVNGSGVPSVAQIVSLGTNLIADGGFEGQATLGQLEAPWSGVGDGTEESIGAAGANTGTRAAQLSHAPGSDGVGAIRQGGIAVEPSTTYTVSAWVDTSNNWSEDGTISVRDGNGALLTGSGAGGQSAVTVPNAPGYRHFAFTFTTGSATTAVSLEVGAGGTAAAATWLRLDDVALVKNPNNAAAAIVSNANLVDDGGFEAQAGGAVAAPWQGEGTGSAVAGASDGNAFLGTKYGALVHEAGQTSWGNIRLFDVAVQPNTSYTLTAWVQTSNNWTSEGWFGLRNGANALMTGNGRDGTSEIGIPSTAGWQRLSVTFDSGSTSTVSVIAGSWGLSDAQAWLRIDEVVLTKNP